MSDGDDREFEPLSSDVNPTRPPNERAAALRRMVAQLVLETTNEGIWLIDAQAKTTFVNHHAAQLLGYTEEEMIGVHIFEFMDEERRPIAQSNLMRRQRGIEERQEVKLRRKDGTGVWVIGSANPVYDSEGGYAGALAMLGDLTVQKETEQRLRTEVAELKERLSAKPPKDAPDPPPHSTTERGQSVSLTRETLRSAVALAACGTFVSTVVLFTAINISGMLLGAGADQQG